MTELEVLNPVAEIRGDLNARGVSPRLTTLRWLPRQWRWLRDLSDSQLDQILEPVVDHADRYDLLCVGADRAKFQIMPAEPFSPSTESIDQYRARAG